MRIAVDTAELGGRPTGVGRYLANLLDGWLDGPRSGDHEFTLFCDSAIPDRFVDHPAVEVRPRGGWSRAPEFLNQQIGLARALAKCRPDVFFAPAYTMPLLSDVPSAVTVHDISFEVHPEWFTLRHGVKMRRLTRASARRADRVITVSRTINEEVQRTYDLPPDRVVTIEHGIDESLLDRGFTARDDLRDTLGFDGPFVLMVGTLFERRYPLQVVTAFEYLRDLGIRLVVVGEDRRLSGRNLEDEIADRGLSETVRWLRYCDDEDLMGLYREASQLIYLSEYEGFGLPPLEAMLFGVPVIASARGALAEIYHDSALLVPDEKPLTIAGAIRRINDDDDLAQHRVEQGRRLVERLTNERCAHATLELLEQVGGGDG